MCISAVSCTKENNESSKPVSAKEWLCDQSETDKGYLELMDSTDEVYSLYVSGSMSSADFLVELEILQSQLFYIQSQYTERKSKTEMTDLDDQVATEGIEHLENVFTDTNELYVSSLNSRGEPYSAIEITYIYLNYKEKIVDEYSKYKIAKEVILYYNEDRNNK